MFKLDRLDPRAKIVMIIAISTAAMVVDDLIMLAGLLVFTVILLLSGGVEPARQIKQARAAFAMVVFLFILQAIFGRWIIGGMLCIRLLIIIMSALILMTGHVRDYLLALVQWKVPYEIAYMVMTGLHFFPVLKEEALDIYYSIQLRGTEIKKTSVKKKLKIYTKMCLPILAGAMGRARDMSASMEARAFRSRPKRTYMRKLKLKKRDWLMMILFPVLCVGFILGGIHISHSDPALAADTPAEKPSQILLSWTKDTKTTQTISWKLEEKTDQYVRYASKKSYRARGDYDHSEKAKMTVVREGEYYRYEVTLTGLEPGTKYCYEVGAGRKWSDKSTFETGADRGKDSSTFEFMSLGDVQYSLRDRDMKKWGDMLSKAYRSEPNIKFTLMMGDMVEKNADMDDWDSFLDETQSTFTEVPVMTTPGNHETSITPYTYKQIVAMPENGPKDLSEEVYSFDRGDCHFVSLNSNIFADERREDIGNKNWKTMIKEVNSWLEKDLSGSSAKWKIVFMHHPAYPASDDGNPIYKQIRKNWVPIFQKTGVDLVDCGHQHVYMRTKKISGITYMMGDSGYKPTHYYSENSSKPDYAAKISLKESTYQIYSVTEKTLTVRTVDDKGKVVDKFILLK
ncbi:MAG: CbiQ family ECF transporter T component [Eubacteriaceae bacterium]|nr:CbiQ family ECF transporter T component [Eubacteriaceae bacterium]